MITHGFPTEVMRVNPTQETVLLSENGIRVTNVRFIVDGETYAMSGITSIKTEVDHPSKIGPIIAIIAGLLILTQRGTGVLGIVIAVVGIFWFRSKVTEYTISLTSASGERTPYRSTDKAFVDKVVAAINEAIVHRG
jgi:hypothetical protein